MYHNRDRGNRNEYHDNDNDDKVNVIDIFDIGDDDNNENKDKDDTCSNTDREGRYLDNDINNYDRGDNNSNYGN